jgi:hypothetical protein
LLKFFGNVFLGLNVLAGFAMWVWIAPKPVMWTLILINLIAGVCCHLMAGRIPEDEPSVKEPDEADGKS